MSRKRRRLTRTAAAVLKLFLDKPGCEYHGYEILKKAGVPAGTLYPVLERFESREKWLIGSWETEPAATGGKPRRRFYELNPKRADDALQAYEEWRLSEKATGPKMLPKRAPA